MLEHPFVQTWWWEIHVYARSKQGLIDMFLLPWRQRVKEFWALNKKKGKKSLQGGLEPPSFRLTVERANQLRHWSIFESLCFVGAKLAVLYLEQVGSMQRHEALDAELAQSVERESHNLKVGSSSLPLRTLSFAAFFFFNTALWLSRKQQQQKGKLSISCTKKRHLRDGESNPGRRCERPKS